MCIPSSSLLSQFSAKAYFSGRQLARRNQGNPSAVWTWLILAAIFCLAASTQLHAQTFTTIVTFDGSDGTAPYALVEGRDGNFYGTTEAGGANGTSNGGDGTFFRVTSAGTLTTLYDFCSQSNCTDGQFPSSGLTIAKNGYFYGTTEAGGKDSGGTVFKITTAGKRTTLYNFCSKTKCADGEYPEAPVIFASDGNFYGTTYRGGSNNTGTVYKLTSSGTLTTLHNFVGGNIDSGPLAPVVQGSDGNFYGTTSGQGKAGAGSIFKITATGKFTTLYSFCSQTNCSDGSYPQAGLIQATDGNLYGTTTRGGVATNKNCSGGCGTIFKITLTGQFTTLYRFNGPAYPSASLVQASDGNLYGTTTVNGGKLFKITSSGALTTLHTFNGSGYGPMAPLLQASDGVLYGTTFRGGPENAGTVFSLDYGLKPPSQ